MKRPAVQPSTGSSVTLQGNTPSNANLQPRPSQDQPPKSRDFIGGGSTHQGGTAGHDGRLPVGGTTTGPTDQTREQPKGPGWGRKFDTGVPTVGLDHFSRDAQIGKLRDPAFGLPAGEKDPSGALSGANRSGNDPLGGRVGRKTVSETMDSLNRTPHNGDGQNNSSRTEQQSSESNEYGGKTHFARVGNTTAIVMDDAKGVTRKLA